MSDQALTIRGGTLVSGVRETRADLLIEDGRVAQVGDVESRGSIIDATGLIVMPGMVDTHVHLMDPGPTDREDFPTGTRAAAARGVTTIVEHTHAEPVKTAADLSEKRAYLSDRSNVDFGLAAHVWADRIDHIPDLHNEGISFFKIFTCTTHGVPGLDTAQLEQALRAIAGVDGRALIHNEDEALTAGAEQRLRDDGRIDPGLLIEWRSREAESVAVATTGALVLASGARVTFAHVSNSDVLDLIDAFRGLGATISAEACPQYFEIGEDDVDEFGALRKFTPPARLRDQDDRRDMWTAVAEKRFSHFSTDHAPSTRSQKEVPFWDAPFGLPGLDTTLPFLLDAALAGVIGLSDVVRLYAEAPAAQYRLPKGRLDVGSDADLVLIDPAAVWEVDDDAVISKAGWTPFAGRRFQGRIHATFLRGVEIARDGTPYDDRTGQFIRPRD